MKKINSSKRFEPLSAIQGFNTSYLTESYRVRKSFPESRAFQYPEKTIAGTETNHTSAESTVSQLSFGTLKVGVALS